MIDEALLVPHAAFPQNLQEWIPDVRLRQRTVGDREIETRHVRAIQVTDEVGRAKPD